MYLRRPGFLLLLGLAGIVLVFLLFWSRRTAGPQPGSATEPAPVNTPPIAQSASSSASTEVYAHNLMLRKGPNFRFYVRWLRGHMTPVHRNINPSFDDPDSFFLDVETGVLRANVGDINTFLNAALPANSPLKNIKLAGDSEKVKVTGTLHKIIPLPIELEGTASAVSGNRIQLHLTKINALKIPLKGLLGGFHITASDLFPSANIPGVQVSGNDVFFDTQQLLPPPHIRGKLTNVRFVYPDLEEVYGNAEQDLSRTEQWRNFIRLRDGTIDFGKLTMHHVDLVMIDVSNDAWFDLDLANYQAQLVNGYTRMTPQAGLQIFMPDLTQIPANKASQDISIQWMKNRNLPPPPEVLGKK